MGLKEERERISAIKKKGKNMGQKVLVGVKNRGKKRFLWWGMGLGSYFCQKSREI